MVLNIWGVLLGIRGEDGVRPHINDSSVYEAAMVNSL